MLVVIGDLISDVVVLGANALQRGTDNTVAIAQTRGGSAANVAAAAASDGPTRFIGSIGTDAAGTALVQDLESRGVEVRVQRRGRTGSIVVLVDDDGERTMLTDRAAAADLGPINAAWLADASLIHAPLYGLTDEGSRSSIVAACEATDTPVSLDLSSVATMHLLGQEQLQSIIDALSPAIVFANEDEAALADELGLVMPKDAIYLVKHGADPVEVRVADAAQYFAVPPVTVVDTTGAGDAFAAGFLHAHGAHTGLATSVQAAIGRAQAALSKPGAL